MALTAAETASVRRHAGYPARGDGPADVVDPALARLSPEEEEVVLTTFLPRLDTLEVDVPDARQNIDTNTAAVWVRNAAEVAEREALYRGMRLRLCYWLGIAPGPALILPLPVTPPVEPEPGDAEAPGMSTLPPAAFIV